MSHPASDSQWPRSPLPPPICTLFLPSSSLFSPSHPLPQCWALSPFLSGKTCSQKQSFMAPISFLQPRKLRPREGLGGTTQLPAHPHWIKRFVPIRLPGPPPHCAASLGTAAPHPALSNHHCLLPPKRQTGLHLSTNESRVMKRRKSSWRIQGLESGSLREGLVHPALCRVGGCV